MQVARFGTSPPGAHAGYDLDAVGPPGDSSAQINQKTKSSVGDHRRYQYVATLKLDGQRRRGDLADAVPLAVKEVDLGGAPIHSLVPT
jgi:hypothetical protein